MKHLSEAAANAEVMGAGHNSDGAIMFENRIRIQFRPIYLTDKMITACLLNCGGIGISEITMEYKKRTGDGQRDTSLFRLLSLKGERSRPSIHTRHDHDS